MVENLRALYGASLRVVGEEGLGFRVLGFGFRVSVFQSLGFGVWGLRFRVSGFEGFGFSNQSQSAQTRAQSIYIEAFLGSKVLLVSSRKYLNF